MKKHFTLIISSFLVLFFSANLALANPSYYPAGTPTRAIQDLDDMLEKFHMGQLTAEQEEENRELKRKIIKGTFNIYELSKLSLAQNWNKISAQQQTDFVQLLTDLLEEKALLSKEQVAVKSKSSRKYTVNYKGHVFKNADKTNAFVRTRVIVPTENITININYKLKKNNQEWQIYDIVVDEASLVDNYRYQFNSIIQKNGHEDLVRRMKEKLDDIRAKRTNNSGDEGV
ncbi:MAG: ABC transporter substrate-binding protein [Pseudomonadota bacterium]